MRHSILATGLTIAKLINTATSRKPGPVQRRQSLPEDFDWSTIDPAVDIEYHDCYDGFRCARLLLPMDWSKHNSTDGLKEDETISVAIVKLPASVPETDPSFGGSIFYNNGGPGNSAVEGVRTTGEELQSLFDGEKHFEIIGVDPRGIGATTPPIRCFVDDMSDYDFRHFTAMLPPVDAGTLPLKYHLEWFKTFWSACLDASSKNSIFPHVTTAAVARDMLEVAQKIHTASPHCSNSSKKHEAKLQYYGVSYGTYLGATFASMFPDQVGLMVLDAVVDVEDFSTGDSVNGFEDMESAIDIVWEYCFNMKDECAVWQETDTSASNIKGRVQELLADLQASPVGVGTSNWGELITPYNSRVGISNQAYFLLDSEFWFHALMNDLADLIAGNYDGNEEETGGGGESQEPEPQEPEDPEFELEEPPQRAYSFTNAFNVIRCTDSYDLVGNRERNTSWAQDIVEAAVSLSPTSGAPAAEWSLRCYGIPPEFKPNYVFQGPFGGPAPDTSSNTTTVAPVLLVNARFDPVTPLSAAYRLSSLLEGSSVVVQAVAGHGVTVRAGDCMKDILRSYFNEGAMPENGTVCQPNVVGPPAVPVD